MKSQWYWELSKKLKSDKYFCCSHCGETKNKNGMVYLRDKGNSRYSVPEGEVNNGK